MKQRSRMEILSHRLQLGHTPSLGLLHKDAGNWSTSPLQCKGNSAEEKKVENSGSAISKYKDAQLNGEKKKQKRITPLQVFNVDLAIKEDYTWDLPQTPHPCADIERNKAS